MPSISKTPEAADAVVQDVVERTSVTTSEFRHATNRLDSSN